MNKNTLSLLLFLFLILQPIYSQIKTIDIDSELQGDLYIGNNDNRQLAIIIAGSGPTNRNGNQPPTLMSNAYKYLATDLQNEGINVFTYDKRVIAKIKNNTIANYAPVFNDNAADLNLIIDYFKDQFPEIILIGHSEGSLVANLSANDKKEVTHFIALQGPGETIDNILLEQLVKQMPFYKEQIQDIHNELKKGNIVTENIPPLLQSLYNEQSQPYLISWIQIDPAIEIKKLKIPVLIIQGEKDLQVNINQGNILKEALPNAELITIKGMNHVMKKVEKDEENFATYNKPDLPLHEELVPTIVNFIKK
ncbi:alpha/beta hydrolase [Myroides injenensis]|uniref:alpha/beta hydrolase n=1 Tax=Myroides injenensis TaxID=1183151 RepID=UPI002270ADDF|nr:alpha/beta hydrolase [Myroides injenensis]